MKMAQSGATREVIDKFDGNSTFTLEYGRAHEGYMDGTQFQKHIKKAINVFQAKYPRDKCVLVVDHSSVHLRYPADGLDVSKINLRGDTDKKLQARKQKAQKNNTVLTPMRSGWYLKDGVRVEQKMYTNDGRRRGLLDLLAERGIKPNTSKAFSLPKAREVLGKQPDFAAQKMELEELCEKLGVRVIKSPKYHPEFNPVELAWAAGKFYAREHCGYSIKALRKIVPLTIDLLTSAIVAKLFAHCRAWRDAYRPRQLGGGGAQNGSEARSIIQATRGERRRTQRAAPWIAASETDMRLWRADDETEEVEPLHEKYQMVTSHRALGIPPELHDVIAARIAEMPSIARDEEDAEPTRRPRARRSSGVAPSAKRAKSKRPAE